MKTKHKGAREESSSKNTTREREREQVEAAEEG